MKFNWKKVNSWLNIGSEISEIVMSLRDRPTTRDFVAVGIRSAKVVRKLTMLDPYSNDYIIGSTYIGSEWSNWIVENCEGQLVGVSSNRVGTVYEKDGVKFYVLSKDEGGTGACYIPADQSAKKAFDMLRAYAWDEMGTKHIYMPLDKDSGCLSDHAFKETYPLTPFFEKLKIDMKTYLNAGITRSYMLTGAPGTGKSCGISAIVNELDLKSFRITIPTSLEGQSISRLNAAVEIYKPEVVIFEDVDHFPHFGGNLSLIENIRKFAKIIVGTCNQLRNLNVAFIRPGRFDEIIHVSGLDKETIKQITNITDKDPEVFNNLKNLPIAYLQEFATRTKYATVNKYALASELRARFEEFGIVKPNLNLVSKSTDSPHNITTD